MRPEAPAQGDESLWPGGARFAFTVFDDTDWTTMVNGPPVYDVLSDLGLRVTKSVWPTATSGRPRTGGTSCDDPDYLAWVQSLQDVGHEIGYHNASDSPSKRVDTITALDRFAQHFGHHPRIGADHSGNLEAMYSGARRLSGLRSRIYGRAAAAMYHDVDGEFQGHDPESPYFWGDLCHDRIDYWRNFSFSGTNVLRSCPTLPYHDPDRPLVKWWFASTSAPTLEPFLAVLEPANLDRLEDEAGVCIIYTHFGVDFATDGKLDPRFAPAVAALAARNGWFAPTSAVLDRLRARRGDRVINASERRQLENRWMADQVRTRGARELRKVLARAR